MDALSEYKPAMSFAVSHAESEDIVQNNLALVVFLARRFAKTFEKVDVEELVSCGNIGLCKAAKHFDKDRNIKFSTFAAKIIEREFLKWVLEEQNQGCRLPKKTFEQVQEVHKFVSKNNYFPTKDELQGLLDRKTPMKQERYVEILNAYRTYLPYTNEVSSIGENHG